jgi:hypothetical protein
MHRGKFRERGFAFFQQQLVSGQDLLLDKFHLGVPKMAEAALRLKIIPDGPDLGRLHRELVFSVYYLEKRKGCSFSSQPGQAH